MFISISFKGVPEHLINKQSNYSGILNDQPNKQTIMFINTTNKKIIHKLYENIMNVHEYV